MWGAAGTVVALTMTTVRSALDAWWALAGILGGGTLGLFLPGFLPAGVTDRAARWGLAAGVLVIAWMTVSPRLPGLPEALRSPFHEFLVIVGGTIVILVIGLPRRTRARRAPDLAGAGRIHTPEPS